MGRVLSSTKNFFGKYDYFNQTTDVINNLWGFELCTPSIIRKCTNHYTITTLLYFHILMGINLIKFWKFDMYFRDEMLHWISLKCNGFFHQNIEGYELFEGSAAPSNPLRPTFNKPYVCPYAYFVYNARHCFATGVSRLFS